MIQKTISIIDLLSELHGTADADVDAMRDELQIIPLRNLRRDGFDGLLAGGKGMNLGELIQSGAKVPPGFVVTVVAYDSFLNETGLRDTIRKFTAAMDIADSRQFHFIAGRIRQIIEATPWPKSLEKVVSQHYAKMKNPQTYGSPYVAVRSSATDEDSSGASFAGQHSTFLGIRGTKDVLKSIRSCFASLYEARALAYRLRAGLDITDAKIAVVVQTMIAPKTSGVMFTRDPNTGDDSVIIEAVYGLGEALVSGEITPSHYELKGDGQMVVEDQPQEKQLVYTEGTTQWKSLFYGSASKLSTSDIRVLSRIGRDIEEHYGSPQDIEWAKGSDDNFHILQTRPITTGDKVQSAVVDRPTVAKGAAASFGIGVGPVRIINSVEELDKVKEGDILVTTMTTPDFVPVFDKIAGLVTDLGGSTCHAAIVSREFDIPCVVGTVKGTADMTNDKIVTVDGGNGLVYRGDVSAEIDGLV